LLFGEFVRQSFKQSIMYRTNFYISILSSLLYVFILMSVWEALFEDRELVGGVTLEQMFTFVTVTFMLNALVRSEAANVIGEKVSDGSISADLLKPVSFKMVVWASDLGQNVCAFLLHSLPVGIVAALLWRMTLPETTTQALLFAVSLALGVILVFHINYVLGLTTFWFKTAFHITWIQRAFWLLFSGTSVPLWFYPETLYEISRYLPFRYVVFESIQIYLGKLSAQEAGGVLLMQLFWIALLTGVESILWRKAQEQVVIHGG